MNKRLGFVATACMLGGGFCLQQGDAVEAQFTSQKPATPGSFTARRAEPNISALGIVTPRWARLPASLRPQHQADSDSQDIAPNAGHKLSGLPPKKSPRLLSEALRSSSKPAVASAPRSSAKPALNAANGSQKPTGTATAAAKPAYRFSMPTARPPMPRPATPANRPAVQTAGHEQAAANAQALAQNQHAASPIQQQLEELYRREGRPMPAMNLEQSPAGTPAAANQRPHQLAQNEIVRPVPQPSIPPMMNSDGTQTHIVPPASKTSRVTGFLSKMNPFKGKSATAPTAPRGPTVQPQFAGKPMIRPQTNAPAGHSIHPGQSISQPAPGPLPVIIPAPVSEATAAARPAITVAPSTQTGLSDALPPVPGDPGFVAPVTRNDAAAADVADLKSTTSVDEALENAFADMPEKDDEAIPDSDVAGAAKGSPFSGVALDEQPASTATLKTVSTEKPLNDLDDLLNDLPTPSAIKTADTGNSLEVPPAPDEDAATLPAQEPANDVQSKMKLIAERSELRGLKGFCPVALRDERDLKNALPEHSSTFKGRTLYFCSADAKAAFDEHPDLYAPAATGNDVVLLKGKTTKEGSLDHAVWFKDRLYLFTSQKTLEQFVAAPSEFAINE